MMNSFHSWLVLLLSCICTGYVTSRSSPETLILPDEVESTFLNSTKNVTKPKLSNRPVIIVVSFDGFRYDYFSKANTPNLDWVKETGVSSPYMNPQFPTKTFPNHQSIATGLHPESHGVINNKFYDPFYKDVLGVGDERFWVYNSDVVPLYVLNEWSGGVSGVMMWPGSIYGYGENKTKSTYVQDWKPSVPFETRVDTVIKWITDETNPANLVFMYFEEPDEHGHGFGPDSLEVKSLIERMDGIAGRLINSLKELNIIKDVNLIFLSDHGFEEVTQNRVIRINTTDIVDPSRYYKYGRSPNFLIQPKTGEDVDIIYEEFKKASQNLNFSVYKKSTVEEEKPYWFYSHNRRISPIILVADLGYAFDDFVGTMIYYNRKFNRTNSSTNAYGTHGYDNHLIHMKAFFRARGPSFRTALEIDPFDNIDLFPLLCHVLKISTVPNNGSITSLDGILFRHGFHIGAPIGWIIGGGIVIALLILVFILSLLVSRRKKGKSSYDPEPSVGYRFVRSDDMDPSSGLVDVRNGNDFLVGIKGMNNSSGEQRALLTAALSDESLSSTENHII